MFGLGSRSFLMKSVRLLFPPMLVIAVITASSCGDSSPTRPMPEASVVSRQGSGELITTLKEAWTLIDSCASLPGTSVTKTIDKKGGMIVVGPDTLIIPANALTKPVTITATLPSGYFVNVVRFQPDGLHFKKSATLIMGYSNCNFLGTQQVRIAQVDDDMKVIEYIGSYDYKPGKTVYGALPHFSNYAVAW
jgi:hypothetical protein